MTIQIYSRKSILRMKIKFIMERYCRILPVSEKNESTTDFLRKLQYLLVDQKDKNKLEGSQLHAVPVRWTPYCAAIDPLPNALQFMVAYCTRLNIAARKQSCNKVHSCIG